MAKEKARKSTQAEDDGKPSGGEVKVKVRHGLAFYLDKDGHQRTVFRNQKVSMPRSEAERLRAHGAVVDVDEDLPMVGRLTPIPNTASDEELIAWVSVATKGEIVTAISENPALGDRILAARDVVKKRLEAQDELLSGIDSTVKQGTALAKKRASAEKRGAPTSGAAGKNARNLVSTDADDDGDDDEEDDDEDDDDLDEDDPRAVVRGNVNEVSDFLVQHPDQAQAVLEAEKALALDKQRDVRPGVIEAVKQAANANNQ
jgi:hypothetical protein